MQADPYAVENNYQQQQHDYQAADHAEMLADAGENKVSVLSGKDCGVVLGVHAGKTPGSQALLALRRLPGYAPAVGVYRLIVGRDQSLLLVVLQKVVPQQRYGRGDQRAAYGEPVQPHSEHKEHHQENAHDYRRAPKVRGNDDYHTEHYHEMSRHLYDRQERVYILVLLQIRHLLGRDDYVQNLYDLGGLYAYAGKSDPAFVAGTVVLTKYNQRHKQQHIHRAQQLPLLAEYIRVNDRKSDKTRYAQNK